MRIIDIPEYKDKKQLLMLDKETALLDAAKTMKKMNYGAVIVTDKKKLCGIFTERDLLMKVVAEGRDIKTLKLSDIMSTKVQTANVNDEVYDCMRRMTEGRFRHLPIVNDEGAVSGMVSQGDFVAITWGQLIGQFTKKAKTSFFSYTQLWMLVIGALAYAVIMAVMPKL